MAKQESFLPENRLLLDAVSEGIYGFDLDGNAVFINPAAERMTGWQASELLGKTIHNFHHHSHEDGSHYPQEDCPIYQTLKDGKAREINNEVFWRKDGSSFPVHYSSTPVWQDGKLKGVVAIFRDISLQRQTEQSLRQALEQVQALSEQLASENSLLQAELEDKRGPSQITGSSETIQNLQKQIRLVANTGSTVLIQGENGTGKELVARELHQLSGRRDKPMISVNCAAFSASLLESELFGHEKGAFTGANSRRKGRFELAHRGTLFLDEVAELSLEAQSKLLRVIQEQEFERLGGSEVIRVDIRLIAATHHDLQKRVEQGLFRMDLFYRLNVFPLRVPPLRQRSEDIPELVQQLIKGLSQKLGKPLAGIDSTSLRRLQQYSWPGNVRELQNMLEREAILADGPLLTMSSIPGCAAKAAAAISLADVEANHIRATLERCHWRISGASGAAALLGLPPSTLRSRMQKLGIHRPGKR